jgi:hypothetical protein
VKAKIRVAFAVLLAGAAGLGVAVTAGAHDTLGASGGPGGTGTGTSVTGTTVTGGGGPGSPGTPRRERTHPHVSPTAGMTNTVFALSFKLRETPGHQGYLETDYRVQVSPRQGEANSCWPSQPATITSGQKGEMTVPLNPPSTGWCQGIYRVTVFLERGPYCPPPQNGQPQPCPEFATQELNTGHTRFTVK